VFKKVVLEIFFFFFEKWLILCYLIVIKKEKGKRFSPAIETRNIYNLQR
jgi:hypothetical protein